MDWFRHWSATKSHLILWQWERAELLQISGYVVGILDDCLYQNGCSIILMLENKIANTGCPKKECRSFSYSFAASLNVLKIVSNIWRSFGDMNSREMAAPKCDMSTAGVGAVFYCGPRNQRVWCLFREISGRYIEKMLCLIKVFVSGMSSSKIVTLFSKDINHVRQGQHSLF